MTLQLLQILRRNNLLPEEVEVVEELPQRLKMRDKTSGIIFYIRKPMPKGKRIATGLRPSQ